MKKYAPLLFLALFQSALFADTYYWHGVTSDFNRAGNWTSNQDGTGSHPASSGDEDFSSDVLSGWTFINTNTDPAYGEYSLTENTDALTLKSRGVDIWESTNHFSAIARDDINGSFDVSVLVSSQTNTDPWAKAGIMAANDITNLSSGGFVIIAVTPQQGVTLQWSGSAAGELNQSATTFNSVVAPVYVRLVKNGTQFTGYYKSNLGDAWTQVGWAVTPVATGTDSEIGLFMTSHDNGEQGTVVMDDFSTGMGTFDMAGHNFYFNGYGAGADANCVMSADVTLNTINWQDYNGDFSHNGKAMYITGDAVSDEHVTYSGKSGAKMEFTASTDQTIIPWPNKEHPAIIHSGTGTLEIQAFPLTAQNFLQTAGGLDFNNNNVYITSSGDFTIENGTSSTMSGMNGIFIQASGGSILLKGQPGNLLNLNPGEYWSVEAGNTLTAYYVSMLKCNANVNTGYAYYSNDLGGNNNWTFDAAPPTTTYYWHGNCSSDFNDVCNWKSNKDGTGTNPSSSDFSSLVLKFNGTGPNSDDPCMMTANATAKAIELIDYTGTLDVNGKDITLSGDFKIIGGTAGTISNLGGSNIQIGGDAIFNGTSGNKLALNPQSLWTIYSTGALLANLTKIANSEAKGSQGNATDSDDEGGNIRWNFGGGGGPLATLIQINTSTSGANVQDDVADFPLLVRLTDENFDFSSADENGDDIRFETLSGTPIPYEIEDWDSNNSKASLWVLVPLVKGNTENQFVSMFWGDPNADPESNGEDVFNSSNGFGAVWHLDEEGNSTVDGFKDATNNNNHAQGERMDGSNDEAAVISRGQKLDGNEEFIKANKIQVYGNAAYTISAWIKGTDGQADQRFYCEGSSFTNTPLFTIGTDASGSNAALDIFLRDDDDDYLLNHVNSDMDVFDNLWHHIAWVDNNGAYTMYVDGLPSGSGSYTKDQLSVNQTAIGAVYRSGSSHFINASVDEVRTSTIDRNEHWIKLSYETQKIEQIGVKVIPHINIITKSEASLYSGTKRTRSLPSGIYNNKHMKLYGKHTLIFEPSAP